MPFHCGILTFHRMERTGIQYHASTWILTFLFIGQVIGYQSRVPKTPEIIPVQKNYSVRRGELAVLHCKVENLGTKTVVWRKTTNNIPLTVGTMTFVSDPRISLRHHSSRDEWNLQIRNASLTDEGTYECQVSTKGRDIRHQVFLDVKDYTPPAERSAIFILGKEYVDKGESIVLKCNATGNRYVPEDIDWFKNGNKIETRLDHRISIQADVSYKARSITSELRIVQATMDDAGTYLCRTSDEDITNIHVHVLNAESRNFKRGTGQYTSHLSESSASGFFNNFRVILTVVFAMFFFT